jgi:hypothetical protein
MQEYAPSVVKLIPPDLSDAQNAAYLFRKTGKLAAVVDYLWRSFARGVERPRFLGTIARSVELRSQ